ncbi:MAG: class I SAM-dependent methyltransferase [Planctomycetota bacterium]|nr:class I SAM-dependent methyltransferase [Planctomycetota bacterium]
MSTLDLCQENAPDYGNLVKDGHYDDMPHGLWGKYDNVRRFWENQVSRFAVHDSVVRIKERGKRLRIADLGCGSGEGWDLLMQIPTLEASDDAKLLAPEDVAHYYGVDLCAEMIETARRRFAGTAGLEFRAGDLREPDAILNGRPPFDLYYSSYGSYSHLTDSEMLNLIEAIAAHARGPAVLVMDMLGQYSLEWPQYWGYSRDPKAPRMMPYTMTWLYPPGEQERHRDEFSDYKLRLWGGREFERFVRRIPAVAKRVSSLAITDRSIFVGRHVDTREFNPDSPPIRRGVNGLFEFNCVTRPEDLLVGSLPFCEEPEVQAFLASWRETWNRAVGIYGRLVSNDPPSPDDFGTMLKGLPQPLRQGMEALALLRFRQGWLQPGDPVANLLQPQFAMLLRQAEYHAQQGLGCSHGFVAVLELNGR